MKRMPFNMIEVLLALGVIAIGAVSVLALFPYGFASNRDSVAESFAGDSADQFLHWFAAQAQRDWDTYPGNAGWLPTTKPAIPAAPPGLEAPFTGTEFTVGNLRAIQHSTPDGMLKATTERGDPTQPIVDFSGVYRMWREDVTMPYIQSDGTPSSRALTSDSAVAINLEASWPAEIPYERRKKKVYRLEVFRGQ